MPKKKIDLSGIDFSDLNPEGADLGKKPKLPYKTHEWSDLVSARKRLKRWEILKGVEVKRLSIIEGEIEKLKQQIEELENTEFSQG